MIELAPVLRRSCVVIFSLSRQTGYWLQETERVSEGSGFVATKDRLIITSDHVVAQAGPGGLYVKFSEEKEPRKAAIVIRDERNDLALLRVEGRVRVPPLPLGNSSSVVTGQGVLAVGNPFRYPGTITKGIVSVRYVFSEPDGEAQEIIQTDAAINPGNSGGPLVNAYGEVIGINRFKVLHGDGMGFAVPIRYAKALIRTERTQRGRKGR